MHDVRKAVVFFEHVSLPFEHNFLNKLKNIDLQITQFKDFEYLHSVKDHRIYNNVLDFCQKNNYEYLFLPYFQFPEYLLSSLKVRKNFKTKIILVSVFSWWHNSEARANSYKELLDLDVVKCLYYLTIDPSEKIVIPEFAKVLRNRTDVSKITDVTKKDPSSYKYRNHRDEYGLKDNEICVLFFGSAYYGKGIDILANAINNVDNKQIKFFIAATSDFNFESTVVDEMRYKENVKIISWGKKIPEEELLKLFSISDLIVLPYRLNYEYGSSSVFSHSIYAGKILLVSDMYPFNAVVKNYKLGYLFGVEDYKSLAKIFNSLTVEEIKYKTKEAENERFITDSEKLSIAKKEIF